MWRVGRLISVASSSREKLMAHGPTYYPSKGACIYCGVTGVPLKDEHVVPYSLGGQHVLRNASCAACEDVTKKFEQDVARDLWGDARTAFDAPSRRKRERKTHVEMPDAENPAERHLVPATEYPAGFVFYKMGDCGFLRGVAEATDISPAWEMIVIDDEARRKAFIKKYNRPPVIRCKHVPDAFGRLLAKIAYCQVLTGLDIGDFHPIALPYVMGDKKNVSYIVGSKDGAPEPDTGYRLTTLCLDNPQKMFLMAEVRLYANAHTPTYQVLVGEVKGDAEMRRVEAKLFGAATLV
jgi:hypothetical protein